MGAFLSNPTSVGEAKSNRRRGWNGALQPIEVSGKLTKARRAGPRISMIEALAANIAHFFTGTNVLTRMPARQPRMKTQINVDDS